jgi:hypothetical protein
MNKNNKQHIQEQNKPLLLPNETASRILDL